MPYANRGAPLRAPQSPIRTVSQDPDAVTHEGAAGFTRDAKSDLFLLAVVSTSFAGNNDTFYEASAARETRFRELVAKMAAEDPEWLARFIPWLRTKANMRTAAVVAAVEYALAGGPEPRGMLSSALQRADEPAEAFAYFKLRTGRNPSGGVQRGIALAAQRLFTEYAALKYGSTDRTVTLADVVDTVHPKPADERQAALFHWLVSRRKHGTSAILPEALHSSFVARRLEAEAIPAGERRTFFEGLGDSRAAWLSAQAATWEWLSGWLQGPMDRLAWESIAPQMGYMALLRNLRNFDNAGMSDEAAATLSAKLSDPAEVARSKQFPYRFLSAYKAVDGLRWAPALETALELSMGNVPSFPGRTLVLTDTSGSMSGMPGGFGRSPVRSTITPAEIAALFAVTVAKKGEDVQLVQYASTWQTVPVKRTTSVLRAMRELIDRSGQVGHGTETFPALAANYDGHDRVCIFTDGQAHPHSGRLGKLLGADGKPRANVYTWNLGGYDVAHAPSGVDGWHELGGFTDKAFTVIEALEKRRDGRWPWE